MKNITKLLAASAASLLLCTSCASGEAILTYKNSVITENEFTYYLATYKARFDQTYVDFEDTAEFYATEVAGTGMTGEEFIFDAILNNVKMTLVCDAMAKEAGLTVDDSIVDTIDTYLEDFVYEYSAGSKTQFNQALSQYGINYNMLREIYLRDERGSALYDHLYGEGGEFAITDEDRTAYLNENYVRVRHIYVNNKYTYATDADGVVITNSDGTYQTTALSAEDQAAKDALVAAIDAELESGADFDTVYNAFSEDTLYENGYYLTRDMDFVDEVVGSAFDLEIGKYIKLESDVGTHYIMRMEMDESPWDDEGNEDFFTDYDLTIGNILFTEYIGSFVDEVAVNEEVLAQFSVEESPSNTRF